MENAEAYLDLIRKDSFLKRMLASYDRAAKIGANFETLDFGCGYGFGTYVLGKSCRKVVGYDPDKVKIRFAKSIFFNQNIQFFSEEKHLLGQSYDMVCLFMVLPHIKETYIFLDRLSVYVKQNGIVCVSYKLTGSHTQPNDDHLFRILEQLKQCCGFELLTKKAHYLSNVENLVECVYCKNSRLKKISFNPAS